MNIAPCDFCESTHIGDPVKLLVVVLNGETAAEIERFRVTIYVCYSCRIIGRVIEELKGEL